MTIAAILQSKGSEVLTVERRHAGARGGRLARDAQDRRRAGGRGRRASSASCRSATSSTA